MNTQILKSVGSRRGWQAAAVFAAAALFVPGCTKVNIAELASSYLVVESIQAAPGNDPTKLGGSLASDVLTMVGGPTGTPTVFSDPGQVTLKLGLKDPGSALNPLAPSPTQFITVNRYRVRYVKTTGTSVQGVDVPFEFEGATTGTVGVAGATFAITLVRVQAKTSEPLASLAGTGASSTLSTIAEITLFGRDQAGHDVSVTATISVNFGDWAD